MVFSSAVVPMRQFHRRTTWCSVSVPCCAVGLLLSCGFGNTSYAFVVGRCGASAAAVRSNVVLQDGASAKCSHATFSSSSSVLAATAAFAAATAIIASRRAVPQLDRKTRGAVLSCKAGPPTLYGSMGSRSPLVNWYLHEIGQEFQNVDGNSVDRTSPDFPNPFGQIPALRDGDVSLFESGAILMYLADKYGGLDTPEKRAEANKWIVFANATLDGICFKEDGNGRVLDTGLRDDPKQIAVLDKMLKDNEFLLGNGEEKFSVADVAVGSYLLFVPVFFNDVSVAKWPNVQRYMIQLCQRPAYAKAFGGGTAADLKNILERTEDNSKKFLGLF